MKRLTKRYEGGMAYVSLDSVSALNDECVGLPITKLAKYEDLEEQGLLLKLPCKLGTKVYYAQKCLAPSCKDCLGFTQVNNCYCEFKSRIFEQEFDFRHLKAFGKTVFLTQAEAEEALKKMNKTEE